jgi:hypothetical protein
MYIDFSLFFIFVGIGFVSRILGIRIIAMFAFWGSILYAFINYSFGYVILTAIEFYLGAFIAWLMTGEKPLR